jgi:hypothetical protein
MIGSLADLCNIQILAKFASFCNNPPSEDPNRKRRSELSAQAKEWQFTVQLKWQRQYIYNIS